MITYKIILRLIKLFFYFLSPLIYLFIRLLDLVFTVRVTPIASNRFGHLTTDLEQYIVQKKRNNEMKKIMIYFLPVDMGFVIKKFLIYIKKIY